MNIVTLTTFLVQQPAIDIFSTRCIIMYLIFEKSSNCLWNNFCTIFSKHCITRIYCQCYLLFVVNLALAKNSDGGNNLQTIWWQYLFIVIISKIFIIIIIIMFLFSFFRSFGCFFKTFLWSIFSITCLRCLSTTPLSNSYTFNSTFSQLDL